jgi:beta-mannanase
MRRAPSETTVVRGSRWWRSLALMLAGLSAILISGCGGQAPEPPTPAGPKTLVIPPKGIYAGAYIDAGEREQDVTLETIEAFETMVGKHQAIVASSSYWGEQSFPEVNVRLIARHNSVPMIYWSPWDRPYIEGRGPDKYSLTSIVAGEHDAYIDRWADAAKACESPMIVSFGNEMNGSWFPWSGSYYGAGEEIHGQPVRYKGPETFKAAYRHCVDRVRARGAKNVLFVLHLMDFSAPNETWNLADQYFPGSDYCDWLGISVYGSQFPTDDEWAPFKPLVEWPYEELTLLDPKKPIMFCEWGVAELPRLGDKSQWFRDAFRIMQEPRYDRLKAIVYWHERWQNSATDNNENGENAGKYSNLRVNSSPAALEAYRKGLAQPHYLGFPIWAPAK